MGEKVRGICTCWESTVKFCYYDHLKLRHLLKIGMATVNRLTGRMTDYRLVKSVTEYSSRLKKKKKRKANRSGTLNK